MYDARNKIIISGITAFFLIFAAGCQEKKVAQENKVVIPVTVDKIVLQDIQETLDYIGDIRAFDEVAIYPKVSGKIIEKVKEEGASVLKGEIIAYIDRDEVGLKFERAPVESPRQGIIGRIYVDIGTQVSPQTAIGLVVNMDAMKINLDIPEKYLPRIFLGQDALISVDAYEQEQFKGTISKITPVVDIATRSSPMEITVANNDHRLKSGMFARVKLVLQTKTQVPLIPKEAIIGQVEKPYIYIIENGKARLKKIALGLRQGQVYEVTEGLHQNDEVVIIGQQRLFEGADVLIEEKK